ncbi:MAG: hypothetical protein KTR28_03590 [Micavibrio sp.]|nr:hypothetical protein [Micavibrio sp.]
MIYLLSEKTPSTLKYLGILTLVYLAYEAALFFARPYLDEGIMLYITPIIFYIIPYSLIFAFALKLPAYSFKLTAAIFALAMSAFISMAIVLYLQAGHIVPTWHYKYPPSLYYIAYAFVGCIFAWMVRKPVWGTLSKWPILANIISFMASNSLWIYLWHIPLIEYIDTNFAVKFAITITTATALTFAQAQLVNKIILPRIANNKLAKEIKSLFTG